MSLIFEILIGMALCKVLFSSNKEPKVNDQNAVEFWDKVFNSKVKAPVVSQSVDPLKPTSGHREPEFF